MAITVAYHAYELFTLTFVYKIGCVGGKDSYTGLTILHGITFIAFQIIDTLLGSLGTVYSSG